MLSVVRPTRKTKNQKDYLPVFKALTVLRRYANGTNKPSMGIYKYYMTSTNKMIQINRGTVLLMPMKDQTLKLKGW